MAIIGESPAFRRALEELRTVAAAGVPALITGESGTGKELAAKEYHRATGRSGPLVVLNCGGLPEGVIASELFGHRRGAFTGADRDRRGAFEQANGGTLFLDELGELPGHLQAQLLRPLESGEVRPVGADRPIHVDVQVVAATNRDLEEMVAGGEFREDLYWRIAGLVVGLPPLRERPEDLLPLVEDLLAGRQLSPAAERFARQYAWPGNVRQWRRAVKTARALAVKDGCEAIEPRHLARTLGFDAIPGPRFDVAPPAGRPYMTVKEAARLWRVSTWKVYRLLEDGDIPAKRIGRQWRIYKEAEREGEATDRDGGHLRDQVSLPAPERPEGDAARVPPVGGLGPGNPRRTAKGRPRNPRSAAGRRKKR